MEKRMLIDGMMCDHCRKTVEKALLSVPGVTAAAVTLPDKTAVITLDRDVGDEALMEAVRAKRFTPVRMLP